MHMQWNWSSSLGLLQEDARDGVDDLVSLPLLPGPFLPVPADRLHHARVSDVCHGVFLTRNSSDEG